MKNKLSLLLALLSVAGLSTVKAQKNNPEEFKRIIESRHYIFKALTAYPLSGKSRQLTDDYDLTIANDTLVSYLPYFGRAYTAPIDPTEGGFKFTSTGFGYNVEKNNKGWQISIKPTDTRDVQQFNLTVFDNGNANLEVNSSSRQSISYSGYIMETRAPKKKTRRK